MLSFFGYKIEAVGNSFVLVLVSVTGSFGRVKFKSVGVCSLMAINMASPLLDAKRLQVRDKRF